MKILSGKRLVLLFALFSLVLSGCAGLAQVGLAGQPDAQTVDLAAGEVGEVETAVSTTESQAAPTITEPPQSAPAAVNPPAQIAPVGGLEAVLAQQQAFIDLYTQVNPAVVNINTGEGQGSGFVYDLEGHIVTNNHVIEGVDRVIVTFADGTQVEGEVIGATASSDLAVVKVDPNEVDLTAVSLTDSDALQVGQIVVAIGSPFGLKSTMTTGIISALDRLFPGEASANGSQFSIPNIIQTDAAVNPGNSGGPLLDIYGNVIGINTAIQSPVRGSSGIGLAVPSNIMAVVVPQLIANGRVQTPWLGIAGTELNPSIATQLGLDDNQLGILIGEAVTGSPADIAGLRSSDPATGLGGDILVGVDGQPINEFDDLLGYIVQETVVGQTIQLEVLRDGSQIVVPLTLMERPSS